MAIWILMVTFIAGLSFGCAYYNYLFNAKNHYEDGENQRRTQNKSNSRSASSRTSSRKSGPYGKCIESAGRLLEYYPDSRWEDDALLLLAKAYYRTDQFRSAITKVNELILKYPESPLVTEGLLWKGMSLLKVAQPDSAQLILSRLSGSDGDADLRAQAHYALGEYFYDDERWNSAQEQFREVVESSGEDEWLIGEAWIKVGDCLNRLERYEDAAQLYSDIVTAKNPRRLKFIARREQAIALRELDRYDQALELFEELLDDGAYIEEFPRVELETARCLRKMGQQDEARSKFELLIETETRGEIAAQANYELGYLLWDHWRDLSGARTILASVKRVDRGSPLTGQADSLVTEMETLYGHWQRLMFLQQQLSLLDSTENGLRQLMSADTTFIDSLDIMRSAERNAEPNEERPSRGSGERYRRLDPIERMVEEALVEEEQQEETEDAPDSTEADQPDSLIFLDSTTVADLSYQRRWELMLELYQAASFHLFERNDRDSADYYYLRVVELNSPPFDSTAVVIGEPDIWARTTASLAYIARARGDTTTSDSLYRLITDELPGTSFGRRTRGLLGLASDEDEVMDRIAL
ncbi:MAG: tetratricopeptide repeat protein, partial [Candidatus Electryoneaceae bacterium]|nr:tetratricopeptide repeat protein [Candidatus Electryoneaceae bacterium]